MQVQFILIATTEHPTYDYKPHLSTQNLHMDFSSADLLGHNVLGLIHGLTRQGNSASMIPLTVEDAIALGKGDVVYTLDIPENYLNTLTWWGINKKYTVHHVEYFGDEYTPMIHIIITPDTGPRWYAGMYHWRFSRHIPGWMEEWLS